MGMKVDISSGGAAGSNPANGTTGSTAPVVATEVAGVDSGGILRAVSTDTSGNVNVNVLSSALPTGASTAAKQDTGNTSLSSIDGKTPALGQALAAASVPVVLTAAQVSTLTPLSTVAATQSGTWNITNVSGTVSLPTGAATETTLAAASAKLPATLGAKTIANAMAVSIASDQTVPTSIASLPLPSGAATETTLSAINTKTPALGQAANAASSPVALSTEQVNDLYVVGQSAQTATVNNILTATAGAASTDATGYRSASVQVVSTGTAGTFIFEGSNDNTNFVTLPVQNQLILTATPITTGITATASQIVYTFQVTTRYIRLRIATTITGGSIQAFTKLSQTGFAPFIQSVVPTGSANFPVAQNGTWTVQPGNTANTTAWLVTQAGRAPANAPVFLDFSATNVTTGAWVQFVASMTPACTAIEVINNSASFIQLGTGAAASEVIRILVPPGGNGFIPLTIANATRIALRAQDVSATSGKFMVNFYA